MAAPYSNDLRRSFLQAVAKGKGTLAQLADDFGVSLGWAKKTSATRTRTGETDRPPWRRGPVSKVTPAIEEWLRVQIRRQPDLTLRQLQEQLQQAKGLKLSLGRLWLALKTLGLRLKKSHSVPKNKIPPKRNSSARVGGRK
jgi:transposase